MLETIAAAAEAGADVFVAGSAVYGADDPGKAVAALRVVARDGMQRYEMQRDESLG